MRTRPSGRRRIWRTPPALLLDWKEDDQARAWLKVAEAGLPQVFVLDAPQAILPVGRQRERLDGPDAGDRFAKMAAPVPGPIETILSPEMKEETR